MISNIRLQHFRSYRDESFEFEPGVNIVVGPNGAGKTNLLEGILAVLTGSSYRVDDQELIQFGQPWARIDALTDSVERVLKLEQENGRLKKSYVLDGKPYKLLTKAHVLPTVLFEPNHLLLLHGQPDLRRQYLDSLLEQMTVGYATTRRHYRRALAQRNALLKAPRKPSQDQLFVWNLRLSELGGAIAHSRFDLVDKLAGELPTIYADIAGGSEALVGITYASKLPRERYESVLLSTLEASLERDIARGFTGVGPHRDDFLVSFDGRPAAEVASRGETRTALLALKLIEMKLLETQFGQKPILLLDDVFSELDGKRRHALAGFLSDHQSFITTTDADFVIDKQLSSSHTIAIN